MFKSSCDFSHKHFQHDSFECTFEHKKSAENKNVELSESEASLGLWSLLSQLPVQLLQF